MISLKQKYQQEVLPSLLKPLDLKNSLAVPRLLKVVINVGVGEAAGERSILEKIADDLKMITGQKPKTTVARKSISDFALRKGQPIGLMVTLRNKRMYHFLEKFFRIVAPRIRDFQGFSLTGFDGRGNYNLGLKEYSVFTELDLTKLEKPYGLEITIVTNSGNNERAKLLLEKLGMPFEKKK